VFALAIAIATGILFSFAPLVTAGGIDLNAGLNVGGRSDAAGSARQRVRSVLVISQVALSVGLLVSSGLLIQTLYRLSKERLGFDPEGLITFSTPFSAERRHSGANLWTYERTLLERLQAIPGVRSAAAINVFPLAGRNNIPGQREAHPEQSIGALEYRIVTPAWFEAMRIPILQGRGFVSDDKQGGPPVALINETLAQMWWPRGGALGGRIVVGRYEYRDFPDALEPARTVIGVVGDTKTEIARKARPTIYIPAAQAFGKGTGGMWWVVRAGALAGLSESIRSAIAGVDPTQRILRLQTVTRLVSSSTSDTRFEAWLLGAFASLALALTSIGIYGLLSFSVATRRHEIGTRIALGARRVDIFKMVLSHGFVLTAAGLLAGLAGALAFTRVMKRLLFGVTPTDPLSFAAVAIVLLAVGLLASYAPARRATKVDPLTALRHE
jgi:putative ABC transport system permease protein